MYYATNSPLSRTPQPRLRSSARYGPRRGIGLGADWEILRDAFAGQTGAPAAGNVQAVALQAMTTGNLYTSEDCSGVSGPSTAQLVTKFGGIASSIASKAITFAGVTGPAAPIVAAVGGAIAVFGAIFNHHAAKVQQEKQIICAVVQAINDSLSVIDQAFQQGVINAQGASGSLDQLYSDLQKNVQPILKQDATHCNAACFILAEARAVIGKKKDQYMRVPPPNAPAGSYQQSCRNMVVNGDTLTAECQDKQGAWQSTSLSPLSTCAVIDNVNGQLQCTQAGVAPSLSPASSQPGAIPDLSQISSPVDLVNSLASSSGMPSWAIWAIGGLVAWKLLG
jgi:CVNH domain